MTPMLLPAPVTPPAEVPPVCTFAAASVAILAQHRGFWQDGRPGEMRRWCHE